MITMTVTQNRQATEHVAVPKLARRPVFAIAGAVAVLLFIFSGRYGYFGDELYFLAAGRHLDWGYADQPPLLPLLARAMDTIAPNSVMVLRIPATLATAAGVIIAALIAREMGGARRAQVLAAGAYAVSGQILGTGHYLATSTIDPFLWTVLLWLLVRWIRTRNDRELLWIGMVTAVALNVKLLMVSFWLVAGLFLLLLGPREIFRRRSLWVGVLIAVVSIVPTLIWQASHGWPQLDMGAAVSEEVNRMWGGRIAFIPDALVGAGMFVGAALVLYGLWRLLRSTELRTYRFLGWTTLGLVALFVLMNGRFYYISGMYSICWAAAAVEIERGKMSIWWRWIPTLPVYVLSALFALPAVVPVYPQSWLFKSPVPRPAYAAEEIGWPQVADSVADVYFQLPADQRSHTAILAKRYWQAGALDQYGPERGLPEPYSGNRGYFSLAIPPESAHNVLWVGWNPSRLRGHFSSVKRIGTVYTGDGVVNSTQGMTIWLASGRTEPWSSLWPKFLDMSA